MMNWYSQLTRLILDFYRENPTELGQLKALHGCKLTRWWGVLRVHCRDLETAEAIARVANLIQAPVAELRLAQQIKILVNGDLVSALAVQPSPANNSDRSYGERQSW
ncbi:MAG: hypothetical protein VKK04_08990 [Synechococcales bacterium]|nr:hypothetical protein [Synechococcales bacterium]